MKTYGKYYAVVDLGRSKKTNRWLAVASIPAYAESCIAGAEAAFRFMGFNFAYARNEQVLKQRNFAGFSVDYVDFNISHDIYELLGDLEFAERVKRTMPIFERNVSEEDSELWEAVQRRKAVLAEYADLLS